MNHELTKADAAALDIRMLVKRNRPAIWAAIQDAIRQGGQVWRHPRGGIFVSWPGHEEPVHVGGLRFDPALGGLCAYHERQHARATNTLPVPLHGQQKQQLTALAAAAGTSRSDYIRQLIAADATRRGLPWDASPQWGGPRQPREE
jgi:hypothetical protein